MNKPLIKKVNGVWRAISSNYNARLLLGSAIAFCHWKNKQDGIVVKGQKATRKTRRIKALFDENNAAFESAMDSVESGWQH